MFRLHCNKCYRRPNSEPPAVGPFHLTRCHHILCASCVPPEDAPGAEKKCKVCGAHYQGIALTRSLPGNVASYFEDPHCHLQLYRRISKFQADQRTSDNLGHWLQMQKTEEMQRQLAAYHKMEEQFNEQIRVERERIAQIEKSIAHYEQVSADLDRCIQIDSSSASPSPDLEEESGEEARARRYSLGSSVDITLSD
ncbi:hypothetical protein KR018_008470, partial [Drosophila ironensis]